MAHAFRAKTFVAPASALDNTQTDGRGDSSMAKLVEDYLTNIDSGGSSTDSDEVISITSCKLNGDKVIVFVLVEDQYTGG